MTKQLICNEANFKVDMVKGGDFIINLSSKKYYWIINVEDSGILITKYVGTLRNYWYRFKYCLLRSLGKQKRKKMSKNKANLKIADNERYIVIDRELLRELPLIISAPFTEALGRFQKGLDLVGHSSPKYKVSIIPEKE